MMITRNMISNIPNTKFINYLRTSIYPRKHIHHRFFENIRKKSFRVKPQIYLRTKIYLMIINLDLDIIKSNDEEAYNQEDDLSEIFYYKLNKINDFVYDIENEDYDNDGDFENLYNE